jgi:hypothetical protein
MVRLMTLPPPPPLIAGVEPLKADETKAPLKPRSLVQTPEEWLWQKGAADKADNKSLQSFSHEC